MAQTDGLELDELLGQAVQQLREAGHDLQADRLQAELVGRNVLSDRWTFQIVEEYDSGYWSIARDLASQVRGDLAGGARHVHEAQMKAERATPGHPDHPDHTDGAREVKAPPE